jgi:acetyltransferase-like isoleucine patch superfamily enzyme
MPRGDVQELEKGGLIRQRLFDRGQSAAAKYQALVTGRAGKLALVRYELTTLLFGGLPGALGLAARKFAYRGLFRSCGRGLVVGRGVTLRHADKITLGNNVIIDDFCVLDGRGSGDEGVVIGDNVIISRGCTVQSKFGPIRIGTGSNIGAGTLICAMGGVEIGESVLIAGSCSISGGQYHLEDLATPIMHQGAYTRGPVSIGNGSWLGMKVLVLDSVAIGQGCAVGSGSVVTRDLPDFAIAAGAPARLIKMREPG